jgi:Animal haem peroxidase
MFRNVPSFVPLGPANDPDAPLRALANGMLEQPAAAQPSDTWAPSREENFDSDIPAGYTYLGQFIDHDITFDPVSSLQRQNDPDALHNFRTPRFDLDSLYGKGPNNDPFMYDPDIDGGAASLLVVKTESEEDDLPRNKLTNDSDGDPRGRALIGDPRNDENIIVSQLHLTFMKFHNRVVTRVKEEHPGLSGDALFEEAQRIVRWHYQWVVVKDFLPRIVGIEVVENILNPVGNGYKVSPNGADTPFPRFDLKFFRWQTQPFMPVEFSAAAYRFGHSMIRPTYKINDPVPERPIFSTNPNPGQLDAFHGFRPLPAGWTVDWSFFFNSGDESKMQVARRIDSHLALGTFHLPETDDVMRNLALRNLKRGKVLGLPSGQRVARAMGIEPLTDDELEIAGLDPVFVGNAPLWFYVLKEAERLGQGKLGPVGGRIVAEVLLGLLKGDPLSYINVQPTWTPNFVDGDFKMPELIAIAQET